MTKHFEVDYFNNCGLLRLDLRSDYEIQDRVGSILGIIFPRTKMSGCDEIAVKGITIAEERIAALEHIGFCLSDEFVIGYDGIKYGKFRWFTVVCQIHP